MIDCIEILIVLSFMAFCLHGAYLIITKEEQDNE
jgi:hypothetical protein